MRIALDRIAAGDQTSINGIFVDIHIVLVLQPGDLIGHGCPVVVDRTIVEIPIVIGISLNVGVAFSRLEGCEEKKEE